MKKARRKVKVQTLFGIKEVDAEAYKKRFKDVKVPGPVAKKRATLGVFKTTGNVTKRKVTIDWSLVDDAGFATPEYLKSFPDTPAGRDRKRQLVRRLAAKRRADAAKTKKKKKGFGVF